MHVKHMILGAMCVAKSAIFSRNNRDVFHCRNVIVFHHLSVVDFCMDAMVPYLWIPPQ